MSQTHSSVQQGTQAAKGKAQEASQSVKEGAGQAMDQAKNTLRHQVDQRSTQAGDQITTVADDIRKVGKELRNQEKDTPARLADQGAEKLEQLGSYLKQSDGQTILSDVEDFARKQPWVVVAGGIALGFVASRFLKASSSRRYATQYGWRLPASDASGVTGELPSHTETGPSTAPSGLADLGSTSPVQDAAPTYGTRPVSTGDVTPASTPVPETDPIIQPGGGQ